MGKKYDAWQAAKAADKKTQENLAVANGGSSRAGMSEALSNAAQNKINEDVTYHEFIEDPEG